MKLFGVIYLFCHCARLCALSMTIAVITFFCIGESYGIYIVIVPAKITRECDSWRAATANSHSHHAVSVVDRDGIIGYFAAAVALKPRSPCKQTKLRARINWNSVEMCARTYEHSFSHSEIFASHRSLRNTRLGIISPLLVRRKQQNFTIRRY